LEGQPELPFPKRPILPATLPAGEANRSRLSWWLHAHRFLTGSRTAGNRPFRLEKTGEHNETQSIGSLARRFA
jgi:hypothetical protein